MLTALKRVSEKVVIALLKFISGLLQRALVVLTLFIAVLCCAIFLYGLYSHSIFYCAFSCVGEVVFVYVNKQT